MTPRSPRTASARRPARPTTRTSPTRPTTRASARRRRSRERGPARGPTGGGARRLAPAPLGVRLSPDSQPAGGGGVDDTPDRHDEPADDRRPGLPAGEWSRPREELGLLRDPAAVPRDF